MAVAALIPVKRLGTAKTRLSGLLSTDERARLMRALVTDVVAAVRGVGSVESVALATSDPGVCALAAELGVGVVSDDDRPWNDGLAHAIASLPRPASAVAIIAADLPLLSTADVEALVAAAPARGAAIARASDAGTNALVLRPPDLLVPNFGVPGSARRHAERVQSLGAEAAVVDLATLALDLDTPEDVERALDAGGPGLALRLLRELYRNRSDERSRTSSRAEPSSAPAS